MASRVFEIGESPCRKTETDLAAALAIAQQNWDNYSSNLAGAEGGEPISVEC
jgi:hypothetical protein